MNQTFNFQRFTLLLRLHLSEYIRTYLMGVCILFSIWIIMLAPSTAKITHFSESLYRTHGVLFGFIFCGASAWFASESFRVVNTPMRGIPFLTLPASQLEKYLVAFLMILLFVLVFVAVFYTVEGVCFSIINARLPQIEPRYHLLDLSGPFAPIELRYCALFGAPLFFLGSIYFPKVAFIKTSIVAFLLLFATMFLDEFVVNQVFPGRDFYASTAFTEVHFKQNNIWYEIELMGVPKLIIRGSLLLMTLALWVTAYVRFKEKEL